MDSADGGEREVIMRGTARARKTALAVLMLLCVQSMALADTTVLGTNNPGLDVPAVQAAVDTGGVVTLLGTFDFGTAGAVLISRDVVIQGQTDNLGLPTTLIRGGARNFVVLVPPSPVDLTIRDIASEGAAFGWLLVQDCGNVRIHNVRISGIEVGFFRVAIQMQPRLFANPRRHGGGDLRGNITIEDVVINMPSGPSVSIGVFINNLGSLDSDGGFSRPLEELQVQVRDTTIRASTLGMITHSFAGTAIYESNDIEISGPGLLPPDTGVASGLFMGNNTDNTDGRADIASYFVQHNRIDCGDTRDPFGAPAEAACLLLPAVRGAVLKSNSVSVERGVGLLAAQIATDLSVTNMVFTGTGESAIVLDETLLPSQLAEEDVSQNIFKAINLGTFSATGADITIVEADENTFVGIGDATVSDGGTANVFTGDNVQSADPGWVGGVVSATRRTIQELFGEMFSEQE